jgi:hypothetical protein
VDAVIAASCLLAAVSAVITLFPPEGHVLTPVHAAVEALLGRGAFLLPVAFAVASVLAFVRRARPGCPLPTRRLVGLAVMALALLANENMLGYSTGLVGEWLTAFLAHLLGVPLTVVLTLIVLAVGGALALDVWRSRLPRLAAKG